MGAQSRHTVVKDFCVEKDTNKKPMSFLHYHASYEIYYVLSGSREYFIANEFFTATEDDFVLVPQNVLHRTAGKGATRILLYVSDRFLLNFFSQDIVDFLLSDIKPGVFHPMQEESMYFYSIIKTLLTEYTDHKSNTEFKDNFIVASYLYVLLFNLTHTKNTHVENNSNYDKISNIIRYIDNNYQSIKNIDYIAEKFYITKYHLCRIFNKYLGSSLITYLNIVKIKAACEMIKNSNKKMVDIAMACGFNSSAYFCNAFKREMGISPKEYQKINK